MLPFSLKLFGLSLGAAFVMSAPAFAQTVQAMGGTAYDEKSAVIFAYYGVGNDDAPSASLTTDQFTQQIDELTSGSYTIKPLPEIVNAFLQGRTLPPRTVAITFDGADQSVIDEAAPLLIKNKLPFTVFIPADRVSDGKPPFMTWDDLRELKRTGLVTFGLHPSGYNRLADASGAEIRRQINNSVEKIREELDINVSMVAYPFGEYDDEYKKIVKDMGFKAAFGQQSGVAYAGDDFYALPRFTLTERYGDLDRFVMTANALPLPVKDVSPPDPHLTTLNPAIGFTVPDDLVKSLKKISCFSSSDEKPKLDLLGNRVEIRMSTLNEDRPRINCTLPVQTTDGQDPRWRWFGMMYTVPQELLESAQKPSPEKHASDTSDSMME